MRWIIIAACLAVASCDKATPPSTMAPASATAAAFNADRWWEWFDERKSLTTTAFTHSYDRYKDVVDASFRCDIPVGPAFEGARLPVAVTLDLGYAQKGVNWSNKRDGRVWFYIRCYFDPKTDSFQSASEIDWKLTTGATSWPCKSDTHSGFDKSISKDAPAEVPDLYDLSRSEGRVEIADLARVVADPKSEGRFGNLFIRLDDRARAQLADFLSRAAWYQP